MAKKKKGKSKKVSIPADLFKEIESRVEGGPFGSVSEYVTYVLHDVIAEEEETEEAEEESYSKEDEEKIKERLRDLGYQI